MDEEERLMPDDPCDHITDITGWITYDKENRSGTGEILRVDAVENAPRRSQRKKYVGFGLSD
jgi:hypothetical protein